MKQIILLFINLFLLSTVSFSQNGSETYSGCEGDGYSVDVNGTIYDETNQTGTEIIIGGATDTSDSTVIIDLTFNPAATGSETYTGCENDGYSVDVNGTTYDESNPIGTETFSAFAANGCDSIVTINLIFDPTTGNEIYTGCEGDGYSVDVNGNTYDESNPTGTETFTGITANGCDSIVTIDLGYFPITFDTISISACNTYTTPSGDSTYTVAGVYNDTIPNVAGCDSIITINLSIGTIATSDTVTVFSCENYVSVSENYTWTTDGVYNDTIRNAAGCDSIIVTNLTISQPTTSTININACDTYTTPSGDYTYITAGVYNDTIPNVAGCDSIITINLTINTSDARTDVKTACFSYTWIDTITYTYNNNTATHTLNNSAGCDSIITLNLTINTFNRHIAVGPDNDILKVTKGFDSYQWVDCDNGFAPIPGATDAHFSPNQNGSYAVIMKSNSCTDTSECKTINNAGLSDENLNYLTVYPNPTSSKVTVTLGNNEKIANVRVFDLTGKEVQNKAINNSTETNIIIQGNNGFYIIEVTTQSNQVVRRRISKLD